MELEILSRKLWRQWGLSGTSLEIGLQYNPRLTRSVARYRRDNGVIELGSQFFRLRGRRKEVLCHELAHVAVHHLYGNNPQSHGGEWRRLIKSAGFTPSVRLPTSPAHHSFQKTRKNRTDAGPARRSMTSRYVYEHRCPVCQMTRRARRSVSQWRCAACVNAGMPGTLEITRVMRQ
jgi:predicted SprT family Zn-dependent metalloprotease